MAQADGEQDRGNDEAERVQGERGGGRSQGEDRRADRGTHDDREVVDQRVQGVGRREVVLSDELRSDGHHRRQIRGPERGGREREQDDREHWALERGDGREGSHRHPLGHVRPDHHRPAIEPVGDEAPDGREHDVGDQPQHGRRRYPSG